MGKTIAFSLGMLLLCGAGACAAPPSFEAGPMPSPGSPPLHAFVTTPQGLGTVVGSVGNMGIVNLPGAGGQALIMDNGNGTSTLVVPHGPPQTVPTPR